MNTNDPNDKNLNQNTTTTRNASTTTTNDENGYPEQRSNMSNEKIVKDHNKYDDENDNRE
jgi:hypothetical protein